VETYSNYIGGNWAVAQDGSSFESENPFEGSPWATVPDSGQADVDSAVAAARQAVDTGPWSTMNARDRGKLMRRLGDLLVENAENLARFESKDNGKLYREMLAQMQYLPEWFYYFAGAADKLEGSVVPSERPNFMIYTLHEPVGVVAAITPWNSPVLLLGFKLAPALAAGCTVVVKPSEYTSVSTLEFAKLFDQAGFPPGVLNVITGGRETGALLAAHPGVDKLAFTGSNATGAAIIRASADTMKLVSLELGGKSPNIVFEDADIEAAANGVIAGVFGATGQTCMAGSRLLVQSSIAEKLVNRIAERARTIKMGDPMAAETEMGPMATRAQFDKVMAMLDRARNSGANIVCGGNKSTENEGYFIEPTIITNLSSDAEIGRDEIFGPVLSVFEFDTEEDAIRIANDTVFGLAAGVWTLSGQRGHRVAHRLRAGTVWINAYRVVAPNAPFGGYKQSGIGRENGLDAMKAYTQTKAVWVELAGATRDPFSIG
jgi:(Z)-2-((N-methylformamido)methylene)-5-hydroxybutyrolactone dehydrogenase